MVGVHLQFNLFSTNNSYCFVKSLNDKYKSKVYNTNAHYEQIIIEQTAANKQKKKDNVVS